jgi:hypothetical protein
VDFIHVCRLEAERGEEVVEPIDDALVEAVELRSPVVFKSGIGLEWTEKACRKRRIDALEELEEDQAD